MQKNKLGREKGKDQLVVEMHNLSQGRFLAARTARKDKHHTKNLEKLSVSAVGQNSSPTGKAWNNKRQKDLHFLSLGKPRQVSYS